MPQPTNPDRFLYNKDYNNNYVTKFQFLPNPSTIFEEDLNTAFDVIIDRVNYFLQNVIGPAVISGFNISVVSGTSGTNVTIGSGVLLYGFYYINNSTTQNVPITGSGTEYVYLTITETQHTYESDPSTIGRWVNGKSVSGPNINFYSVTYGTTIPVAGTGQNNITITLATLNNGVIQSSVSQLQPYSFMTTSTYLNLMDAISKKHSQNTDIGTTNPTFRVGMSSSGTGGLLVQTVPNAPHAPTFFRMVDLMSPSSVISSLGSNNFQNIYAYPVAYAKFRWGSTQLTGSGGVGTITLSSNVPGGLGYAPGDLGGYVLQPSALDQNLVGMYLYLPDFPKNVIVTNCGMDAGSVVFNVTNVDGSSIDLSGKVYTAANPMILHSNADYYRLILTPVDSNNKIVGSPIIKIVRSGTNSNNIVLETTIPVFVGVSYSITIEAVNGNDISSGKVLLNYGFESFTYSFSKFGVNVYNTDPMPMSFPNDPTAPTVTMNGIAPGLVSISVTSGWTNADSYFILWHDTKDPSQKTAILPKGPISPPTIYLPANPGSLCTATVMPLICGQMIAGTSGAQTVTVNCPSFPASSFHLAPYYWLGVVSQSGTSAPQIVATFGTNMTGVVLNRSGTGSYLFGCNEFLSNRVVHKLIFFTHNSGGNPSSSWGSYDTWDLASGSGVGYIYTFNSSGVLSDGLLNGTLMVLGG